MKAELTNETLHEECNGYDVEDEKEEDVLSILFQEVGQCVPLFHQLAPVAMGRRVYTKTLHSDKK